MRVGFKHLGKPIYVDKARKTRLKTMADATGSRQDAITEEEIAGTAIPGSSTLPGTEHSTLKTSNACKRALSKFDLEKID